MVREFLNSTSFNRQLTTLVGIAILVLALFSSLVNSWQGSQRMQGYLVQQGSNITGSLASQSALGLIFHSADNVQEEVSATLAFPDVTEVDVVDTSGQILLARDKQGHQPSSVPNCNAAALTGPVLISESSDAWRFCAPVFSDARDGSPFDLRKPRQELIGSVQVTLSKASVNHLAHTLLLSNVLVTLSFAGLLMVLLRFLARHFTTPLQQLSSLMRRAESGETGIRAAPRGPRELVDMATGFNQMMSVLEQRETELKHAHARAVQLAHLKAQFAATVSHEVRTPLNGVVGMLDMLKEMRLTKAQRDCVDMAWKSSHALLALINGILDFSKMEAGKLEIDEVEFDVREVVEGVIELLAREAQQKGLEFGYVMAAGLPQRMRGDALRMRQVLLNLAGNAIKFTEHGEVAIRVRQEATSAGTQLRLEVCDTGIGIDPAAQPLIFDSYAQAESSTSREYGGTGLGLAICKQLVELLGGEIGVISQRGEGSRFWFTLPYQPIEGGADTPVPQLTGRHALLLESSPVVAEFVVQTLAEMGVHCRVVADPEQALRQMIQAQRTGTPITLVLMNIGALDLQGNEMGSRLRTDPYLQPPQLVLMDPYGASNANQTNEIEGYVAKPLRRSVLIEVICRAMEQRLDRVEFPSPEPAPLIAQTGVQRECRVLVVEDNRTNQEVAARMLSMAGCICELAGSGAEALQAVLRRSFDIIFMDCRMPGMDGYETTARLRRLEAPQGRHTPIIAMTANAQPGDLEKCRSAGMDDYMSKPVTLESLRRKLARWAAPGSLSLLLPEDLDPIALPAGPLNPSVVQKLRDTLGPALQFAIRPFLEDLPIYLDQLEDAARRGDATVVLATAHSIKGSSSNLGANGLALMARDIEDLALREQLEEIIAQLPSLREGFAAVAEALARETTVDGEVENGREGAGALVLVVEDDRSTRRTLCYTLQRDGFRVEEAENGAQALALLKRIQPDIVLLDAVMPVMDGFTTCARLRESTDDSRVPVLMITALEDNVSVERAFAVGANDYITKPIHYAVLSQRVRRIVDAHKAERRIRHMAYNDLLTGLPNRALFFEQLNWRIDQARLTSSRVAVLFLDLDRFKNVNDTLGHDVGDRLLVAAAQRIRRSVRSVDCVARLGGDEFTVVLADLTDAAVAATVAQNICRSLAVPFAIDGRDIFVTTSVGISFFPSDGEDAVTLLKHADTAMYRAKRTNAGYQFFEPGMAQSVSEQLRLESDLRQALDREEMFVVYQPQRHLSSGAIVGVEALLRWNHPVRGVVSPDDFIAIAEESGLIVPLGTWVMREACAQLASWRASGVASHARVAVNVSVRQLLERDFADTVEGVLRDTGLPPQLLDLEITESTLMEHAQDTLEVLHRLRALGIRVTIDDFGTGYSSLSYLKRFPVDIIKIDRAFVRDLAVDTHDAAIVSGIIALAHSLRLEVVAEGVETEAQLEFLHQRDCNIVQGYYFSHPLAKAEATDFLRSGGIAA